MVQLLARQGLCQLLPQRGAKVPHELLVRVAAAVGEHVRESLRRDGDGGGGVNAQRAQLHRALALVGLATRLRAGVGDGLRPRGAHLEVGRHDQRHGLEQERLTDAAATVLEEAAQNEDHIAARWGDSHVLLLVVVLRDSEDAGVAGGAGARGDLLGVEALGEELTTTLVSSGDERRQCGELAGDNCNNMR